MSEIITVGWREWVALPDLGMLAVRVKVDTGARTSALHAKILERYEVGGEPYVKFEAYPLHSPKRVVQCDAPIIDEREITSSNAKSTTRIVIRTHLRLGVAIGSPEWEIEVTLADRMGMRFPMLLGREALYDRTIVEPGSSYVLGKPVRPADFYAAPL